MVLQEKMSQHGQGIESLGGQTAKKSYVAPTTKVVKFVVEGGFVNSPVGTNYYVNEPNQLRQTDDEDYHWNTASDGWF